MRRYLSRGHGNGELRKTINRGLGGYSTLEDAETWIKKLIIQIQEKGLDYLPETPKKILKNVLLKSKSAEIVVRRYRVLGKTIAEIAKLTGVSESNVYTLVKDMGVDKQLNKQVGTRLTAEQIPFIRQEYADGATLAALGRDYGVTGEMIGDIVHRRAWKHVE